MLYPFALFVHSRHMCDIVRASTSWLSRSTHHRVSSIIVRFPSACIVNAASRIVVVAPPTQHCTAQYAIQQPYRREVCLHAFTISGRNPGIVGRGAACGPHPCSTQSLTAVLRVCMRSAHTLPNLKLGHTKGHIHCLIDPRCLHVLSAYASSSVQLLVWIA